MWCTRTDHRVGGDGKGYLWTRGDWPGVPVATTTIPWRHGTSRGLWVTHIPKITVTDLPSRLIGRSHPSPPPKRAYTRASYARTHARQPNHQRPPAYLSTIPFSLYNVSFFLSVSFTVVLAPETGCHRRAIKSFSKLDRSPRRGSREVEVRAVILEHPCYRLTSDEKCTKLIVCCFRHSANSIAGLWRRLIKMEKIE